MHYVYIIRSELNGRYYVGSTNDIESRIKKHNNGATKSTRSFRPWMLIYQESFEDSTAAQKRENRIKSYKGGEAFKQLIRPR